MSGKMSLAQWSIRLGIIGLAGFAAYLVGIKVGDAANNRKLEAAFLADQLEADSILVRSGSILKRGMAMPLETLFDLEGHPFDAKSLSGGGLLLTYVDPGCNTCVRQGIDTKELLKAFPGRSREFVIVSYNLDMLKEWRDEFPVDCMFLCDTGATLFQELQLSYFPCNMILDDSFIIRDVSFGHFDVGSWRDRYNTTYQLNTP